MTDHVIDHRNNVPTDNSLDNLAVLSQSCNAGKHKDCTDHGPTGQHRCQCSCGHPRSH